MKKEVYIVKPSQRGIIAPPLDKEKRKFKPKTSENETLKLTSRTLLRLQDFEWEFLVADTGAKRAYLLLKDLLEFSDRDTRALMSSKSYFIFSAEPLPNRGAALDILIRSDLSRLRPKAIGCIVVNSEEYCFFWKRTENN